MAKPALAKEFVAPVLSKAELQEKHDAALAAGDASAQAGYAKHLRDLETLEAEEAKGRIRLAAKANAEAAKKKLDDAVAGLTQAEARAPEVSSAYARLDQAISNLSSAFHDAQKLDNEIHSQISAAAMTVDPNDKHNTRELLTRLDSNVPQLLRAKILSEYLWREDGAFILTEHHDINFEQIALKLVERRSTIARRAMEQAKQELPQ